MHEVAAVKVVEGRQQLGKDVLFVDAFETSVSKLREIYLRVVARSDSTYSISMYMSRSLADFW